MFNWTVWVPFRTIYINSSGDHMTVQCESLVFCNSCTDGSTNHSLSSVILLPKCCTDGSTNHPPEQAVWFSCLIAALVASQITRPSSVILLSKGITGGSTKHSLSSVILLYKGRWLHKSPVWSSVILLSNSCTGGSTNHQSVQWESPIFLLHWWLRKSPATWDYYLIAGLGAPQIIRLSSASLLSKSCTGGSTNHPSEQCESLVQ